ncbi:MAG TPA: cytochrome c oxidase subunit II [Hyphomicrobiales bacterium]|nr:cytochrome c oxidase subunit II [Hyphomicrobiales bacterium]
MHATLPLFPIEASVQAGRTDELFFIVLGMSVVVLGVVAALVIGFAIRYRRGSPAKRGPLPPLISREIEIAWTAGTLFTFLFVFWWASSLQLAAKAPPADAMPIRVLAKQWMWKMEHPNGVREINTLHVPIGRPVRLIMTSQDVIHSFYVPVFRMKQDVLPGRTTTTWFQATRTGTFRLECAEFCGTDHARMLGSIVVMSAPDFALWSEAQPESDSLAQKGAALFRTLGCSGCHATQSAVKAPDLAGLYGRAVRLADGRTVKADDAYIRDSILQPLKDIVAGYQPIMPSFAGAVSDADLQDLIAYVRSLKDGGTP